jgi:hypothetical protein
MVLCIKFVEVDYLTLLPHRVRRGTMMMITLVGCSVNNFPPCVIWIVAYQEWLIDQNLMLKLESKDSLFDAF